MTKVITIIVLLILTTIRCQHQSIAKDTVNLKETVNLKDSQTVLKSNGAIIELTRDQEEKLASEAVKFVAQCNFNSLNSEFVPKTDLDFQKAWAESNDEKLFPKSYLAIYFKDTVFVTSISGQVKLTEILFDLDKERNVLSVFTRTIGQVIKYNKCGPIDPLCVSRLDKYLPENVRKFCKTWQSNFK